MKAPYSYFGGKSKVSQEVWKRFGKVNWYLEPFFGSGAVLLNAPYIPNNEIVNDMYCMITNFWRSVKHAPNKTAKYADAPMNEIELHATQDYLIAQLYELENKLRSDMDFYDPKIAGYWVWGVSQWLGDNWCSNKTLYKRPTFNKSGIHRNDTNVKEYFQYLSNRLRKTIVCCGDWERVVADFITTKGEPIGIFLDPPYSDKAGRENNLYIKDDLDVSKHVFDWCVSNGNQSNLRIAFCGYSNEYDFPSSWIPFSWKGNCAWANWGDNKGKDNAKKEVIYFSPHCRNSSVPKILDRIRS